MSFRYRKQASLADRVSSTQPPKIRKVARVRDLQPYKGSKLDQAMINIGGVVLMLMLMLMTLVIAIPVFVVGSSIVWGGIRELFILFFG